MERSMTVNDVGFALMQAHLLPSVYLQDWFRITTEDGDYYVYVGSLPDLYLEKRVSTDLFEYRNNDWMLLFAMDMFNSRLSPVKVFQASAEEIVTFRVLVSPKPEENLGEAVRRHLMQIENAIDQLGHACEVVVRENDRKEEAELMERLADPSPDNPWIQGRMDS